MRLTGIRGRRHAVGAARGVGRVDRAVGAAVKLFLSGSLAGSPAVPVSAPSYTVPDFVGESVLVAVGWAARRDLLLGIARQFPLAEHRASDHTGFSIWALQR